MVSRSRSNEAILASIFSFFFTGNSSLHLYSGENFHDRFHAQTLDFTKFFFLEIPQRDVSTINNYPNLEFGNLDENSVELR